MSEPHTCDFNATFSLYIYIYIYICYMLYICMRPSLDPRLSRAPARKAKREYSSLASFEGFLGFFERTLNDVMRDCHVTNTRFRSGFPFCLSAHAHMHIPYGQLHSSWTLNRPAVDIRSRHSSHYQWGVKRIHLGPKQIVLSLGPVLLSEVCSLRHEQPP